VYCQDRDDEVEVAVAPQLNPRAGDQDLTAKARIRNAALDLYASQGEDRTSMRAIAAAAGVTVGLLVHHYGTKDNIRDAVEELIVDYFRQAIAQAPADGRPGGVAAARNAAVTEMLAANPEVVNYMRRTLLDPAGPRGHLLERLTELARSAVSELRRTGQASVNRAEATQVTEVVIRQLGHLFLQPMLDAMWRQLSSPDASGTHKPVLEVRVHAPGPPPGR
jgi:TetR/AcrR family transcriptional regulator, regulator of cefoperazone and chloramphenicol sensitivity